FNESVMYKDTLKDSGASADKSVEELQVDVELQRLNNHTPEEDQTYQEDGDDEDEGDQETDQTLDLTNYQLSNMAAYAFVATEEEDTHEPLTHQEGVACEHNSKWKGAMKEEMDSLRKNKTWELVDHPAGQKLRAGIDYNEVFSLVVRHTSIRVIRALTACKDYELEQLAVKTAFLHGNLEEVIYMRQPQGYEQGVRHEGARGSKEDSWYGDRQGSDSQDSEGVTIWDEQGAYENAVGSLMYLMVCTRPDIAYAVSVVSRYLANPGKNHWEAVKWILKYLRGIANVGLVYGTDRGNHVDVTGFVDSDYARDPDKGRSITGYTFLVQGCVVSWKATLQHVVALSTTEAEYMALTEAVKEAIWLRGLLEELGMELNTVAVNYDNQGAIHLSRNHVFHERTKHINVRYHFIREVLEAKTVKVLKMGTEHNATDALTKVVPGRKLQHCLELLKVGVG
ncbi:retrovirus-related pol polyprotein from transposon TNT 1-94, partial [Tanacetum coccineum]